jgi:phosphopantothenoylcysteine decarboxylase / phosphopantothenate---cysteine ligase
VGATERSHRAPFSGHRLVLGVTGGIAAYKAIQIARDLTLAGAAVDVVLTSSALEFVRPLTFEALTGRPAFHGMYVDGDPLLHIRLARDADLVLLAPATANAIARLAAGMSDDLLTATVLATPAPVVVCPAMNDRMYAHPQTAANVERLAALGYTLVGPAEGPLAWGEGSGRGRMEEPATIIDHCARALTPAGPLRGATVLVTGGPTREPIDPVRFIGNRSSGRMGFALAAAAWRMGAEVTLVAGPSALSAPTGCRRIDVETAEEMRDAVADLLPASDVLVMAAAVADFRPSAAADQKIKKEAGSPETIPLTRTPDVLHSTMSLRKTGAVVVGFALETETPVENGRRKLSEKRLDLLVVNDAREPGAGFEVGTNRVTLVDGDGGIDELPLMSKDEVADRIMLEVARRLGSNA